MLLGLAVGLGTTKLAAISFAIVLTYLILKRPYVRIPIALWGLIACVGITTFWSVEPGKPVLQACAILLGYLTYKTLPRKHFIWGLSVVALVQIGFLSWQHINDITRPYGISDNASVVGLAGLFGLPTLPMAVMSGLSMSRTAMLGSIVIAITNWRSANRWISVIVLLAVGITTTLLVSPDRFQLDILQRDSDKRITAITGTSTAVAPVVSYDIPEVREREFIPWGYGFGQYYFDTGRIQPHNIFVRTWFELGLLSIPAAYCLLWLFARNGSPDWRLFLLVASVGMFTDELLGSVVGVYMIVGYAILNSAGNAGTHDESEMDRWRLRIKRLRRQNLRLAPKRISIPLRLPESD